MLHAATYATIVSDFSVIVLLQQFCQVREELVQASFINITQSCYSKQRLPIERALDLGKYYFFTTYHDYFCHGN